MGGCQSLVSSPSPPSTVIYALLRAYSALTWTETVRKDKRENRVIKGACVKTVYSIEQLFQDIVIYSK